MQETSKELMKIHGFYIRLLKNLSGCIYKKQLVQIASQMMCCDEDIVTTQINELICTGLLTEYNNLIFLSDTHFYVTEYVTPSSFDVNIVQKAMYRAEILIRNVIPELKALCYSQNSCYPNKVIKIDDLHEYCFENSIQVFGKNTAHKLYGYFDNSCYRYYTEDLFKDMRLVFSHESSDILNPYNFYTLADLPFIISDVCFYDDKLKIDASYLSNEDTTENDILETLDFAHEVFYTYFCNDHLFDLTILCPSQDVANKFISLINRSDKYAVENMNLIRYKE